MKKSNWKRIMAMGLAVVMTLSMAGCNNAKGKDGNGGSKGDPVAADPSLAKQYVYRYQDLKLPGEDEDINITVNGQTVIVTGAQGQTLEVVSLTGRRVMTVKIDSPAQKVELNIPKGCYILKVGKVVRKVSVH